MKYYIKLLILNMIFNITEYTFVYLVKSFCIWNFTNPFQWIIELPNYASEERFVILFFLVAWQVLQIILLKYYFKQQLKS